MKPCCLFLVATLLVVSSSFGKMAWCQEKEAVKSPKTAVQDSKESDQNKQFKAFESLLSDSVLVGNFTVTGKETKDLTPEEYRIASVKKMEEGDYWNFKVRIKYLNHDLTVALPLQVKWAGDTPVITVEGDEVKGFGKFNARVVIHENKYSGTWSHGKQGGHLFGVIKKGVDLAKGKKKESKKADDK